jgi:uncharacterized protein YbaP (TraB family)
MTTIKTLIFIITIGLSGFGYGQTKKPPVKAKVPAKPKTIPVNPDNSLLWEISGGGLTEPSYIYGTMHIVCSEDAKMSEGLKNAVKKSRQVFFEVDLDNMDEMMSILKYARMNDGLKISDLVTPVEYSRLEDYFKKNKSPLPFAMMSRFKPYFITALISEDIMSCKEKSSIEQIIMTEARDNEKDVQGLETIEFQASIFDSIPYEKQARDLVMYVDSIDKFKQTTLDMVDLYRKQDISNMDSLMEKSDPGMMEYMDMLLYDRNKRWAGQIPEQMFVKSTLFAVGAGHLGGSKGVLNLLKQQGFTVKPLDNTKFENTTLKERSQVTKSSK